MKWEVGTEVATAQLDRFQQFSQMAIKYGNDFVTTYMSGIQVNEKNADSLGLVTDYLNYYN
jgi:hypothetical protein